MLNVFLCALPDTIFHYKRYVSTADIYLPFKGLYLHGRDKKSNRILSTFQKCSCN